MNKNKNINKFLKKVNKKKTALIKQKKIIYSLPPIFITLTLNEPRTKYSKKAN